METISLAMNHKAQLLLSEFDLFFVYNPIYILHFDFYHLGVELGYTHAYIQDSNPILMVQDEHVIGHKYNLPNVDDPNIPHLFLPPSLSCLSHTHNPTTCYTMDYSLLEDFSLNTLQYPS